MLILWRFGLVNNFGEIKIKIILDVENIPKFSGIIILLKVI